MATLKDFADLKGLRDRLKEEEQARAIEQAERHLGSEELFIVEKMLANKLKQDDDALRTLGEKCKQMPNRKDTCKKVA